MEIQRPLAGLSLTFHSKELFREGPVGRTCPSEPSKMVFSSGGAASLARLVNFSAGGNSKTSGWLVFDFPLGGVVQGGSCGSDLSLRTVKDDGFVNFFP